MTFNDIFKSGFLEKVSDVSLLDMAVALLLAVAVGLFIMLVYKKTFKGVLYSSGFAVSLLGMTLVTTLIILAVTSNVVLSLGMVGALSIVRFRSAIKEPIDIVFLFWAISAGIVLGAGILPLALVGSLLIGLVLVLFVNKKSVDNPYILVLHLESDGAEREALKLTEARVKKQVVKAKTVNAAGVELTVEVRLSGMTTAFVNELTALPGVRDAVLVSYNGDYMG